MLAKELIEQVKILQAVTVTNGAAGATDINGVTLDMSGFEGVIMEVTFGAIVSGAATSIKAQQGQASNLSDAADLEGTSQTIADTDDEKTFYIALHKPRERYVRLVVKRATQNATCSARYFQYGARTLPVAAHGTAVSGEAHVSPAEGTA
jgi:hypothetical protein